MHSDLPAISFLCAILLATFIPLPRVRDNTANLAFISWLVVCNLVHAINALVWAGNVDVRGPVWCDIVTRVLLGATVALTGACLAMARRLELVSSNRPISNDSKSRQIHQLIEITLCYIIPLVYILFHFTVQDHRFDLIADFGCSASIHPSSPGFVFAFLPPLILCFASFVFSGLTVHNCCRQGSVHFAAHVEKRSPLTSSIFLRRLSTILAATAALFVVTLFSLYSVNVLESWPSWRAVHADMWTVQIVTASNEIASIQLAWWGIPVVSIVYLVLLVSIGEESRDIVKRLRDLSGEYLKRRSRRGSVHILPLRSRQTSSIQPKSPQSQVLKSGWDDMLDPRPPRVWTFGQKPVSGVFSVGSASFVSRSPSPRTPSPPITPVLPMRMKDEDIYVPQTMDYLVSPTSKTMGFPGSPISPVLPVPAPARISPAKETDKNPFRGCLPPPPTTPPPVPPTSRSSSPITPIAPVRPARPPSVPHDIDIAAFGTPSTISSVFDAAWPEPPASLPPSPMPFTSTRRKNSGDTDTDTSSSRYTVHSEPFRSTSPVPSLESDVLGHSLWPLTASSGLPLRTKRHAKRPSVKSLKKALRESFGVSSDHVHAI